MVWREADISTDIRMVAHAPSHSQNRRAEASECIGGAPANRRQESDGRANTRRRQRRSSQCHRRFDRAGAHQGWEYAFR
jgi:hypothetical protein